MRNKKTWVGAVVEAPFYVMEPEPHRPDLAVWLEVPSGRVLAMHVAAPPMPAEAAVALIADLTDPLPRRVRVGADLADAVRARLGPAVEVVVTDAVALTATMAHVVARLAAQRIDAEPSYCEGGRIPAFAVAELFVAAAALHRLAPWTMDVGDEPIAIDVPIMGLHDAAIAVIGGLGESYGFLLFDSLASYDGFGETVDDEGQPALVGYLLSVNFEPREALPASMCREVDEHQWPVIGPDAYPIVLCLDEDGVRRPVSAREMTLASICTRALVHLFFTHADHFRERRPGLVTDEIRLDDAVEVRVRAPHPDSRPLDPDNPCACGSGRTFGGCHLRAEPDDPTRARRRADYDGWPDRRIAALEGRTPREMLATPEGAEKVQSLVRVLEALESEFPPDDRIDLAPLRRALAGDERLPRRSPLR